MASLDDLPPDLRARIGKGPSGPIAPTAGPTGRKFIGSATKEYTGEAGTPEAPPAEEATGEGEVAKSLHTCTRCKVSTIEDHNFCFNCGFDNKRQRAADALGIKISDEDVQDYLFKGYIVKQVPLMGEHHVTFKTSQSKEVDEAEKLTEDHFEKRRPTDMEWLSYRSKILVAFGWVKLDGKSIGDTAKDRLKYINDHGSQLLEIIAKKYGLYQNAIAEVLNSEALGK